MNFLKSLPLAVLLLSAVFSATSAQAQDDAPVHYVAQTTTKYVIPEGSTAEDAKKALQEYFDKVLSKNKYLLHYAMYRHAWGSQGGTLVASMEFASWADIDNFENENEALEKAAWPDETARKAFLKKMSSYLDPYHRDEIYTVVSGMRK